MLDDATKRYIWTDVTQARDNSLYRQGLLLEVVDLLNIRTATVAPYLEVSQSSVSQYRTGRKRLPFHHVSKLRELASHALSVARRELGYKESAIYRERVDRAEQLFLSLDQGDGP